MFPHLSECQTAEVHSEELPLAVSRCHQQIQADADLGHCYGGDTVRTLPKLSWELGPHAERLPIYVPPEHVNRAGLSTLFEAAHTKVKLDGGAEPANLASLGRLGHFYHRPVDALDKLPIDAFKAKPTLELPLELGVIKLEQVFVPCRCWKGRDDIQVVHDEF